MQEPPATRTMSYVLPTHYAPHEPLQEIIVHTPPPSPTHEETESKLTNVIASTILWLCSGLRSGKQSNTNVCVNV